MKIQDLIWGAWIAVVILIKRNGFELRTHITKGAVVVIYKCPIFADNLLRSRGASHILSHQQL
jgi:hypothetical protein